MGSRKLGGAQGEYYKRASPCEPGSDGPFPNSLAIFMAMVLSDNRGSCH